MIFKMLVIYFFYMHLKKAAKSMGTDKNVVIWSSFKVEWLERKAAGPELNLIR